MKNTLLLLLASAMVLLAGLKQPVAASHHAGFDLVLECVNPCTTRIHVRGYRDCQGASGFPVTFNFDPLTTNCTAPTVVSPWSAMASTEVTPICPSVQTFCSNPNATVRGFEEFYWTRDYNVCGLGTGCTFTLGWGACCRNSQITSGGPNQGAGLFNFIDLSMGCNNSPQFTNPPLLSACAGQPYSHHLGGYDPDGDSLAYALAACMTNTATPFVYDPGYSPTAPLGPSWGVTLDPATGILALNPTPGNPEHGVLCIEIEEFRSGNLIGITYRDSHLDLITCPANNQPQYSAYANLSPGATVTGPDEITFCGIGSFCFDIGVTDADSMTQNVTLTWDENIAGAAFSEVQNLTVQDSIIGNSPDGRFCWTPSGPGTYQFLLSAFDDACPFYGRNDKLVTILVGNGTGPTAPVISATGTLDTCSGTTVTLDAGGGYSSYLWSNSATTQTITVGVAGTYSVTVSNGGPCTASASYTVLNQSVPQISGTIFTSTAASLINQKVYLIRHDATLNGLYAEDSTFTDGFGNYSFCGVTLDTMYIKAVPDSATYPTEMPTYADTAIWWNNAEMILAANFPVVKSFQTRSGSNPGGSGFIGGLISQGANKQQAPGDPMPNVTVILYSKTLDQFTDVTTSDANGYFFFADIPLGDYEVSVDVAGVDHLNVPSVLVDATSPTQDSLDFRLHTTYFELVLPTAVSGPGLSDLSMEAFPNPIAVGSAAQSMTIQLSLPEEAIVQLKLIDLRGKLVGTMANRLMTSGTHRLSLNFEVSALAAGLYFLEMEGVNQSNESYHQVLKILVTSE